MAENKLFLALPSTNGKNALDEEHAYLKVLGENTKSQEFERILTSVAAAFNWVEGEEFVLYYDHDRFQELFENCSPEVQKQRPSPVQLLSILSQMTKIPDKMPEITANHICFIKGILYGYVNLMGEALVDHDALVDRDHIELKDEKGDSVKLAFIDCQRERLFQWFVKNRTPQRLIDPNYAKHGILEKREGKEMISARSYTNEEYQDMLTWAIGAPGSRKKYFMDLEKGRLVIFWNENLKVPTFHFYDVDINNSGENAKMWHEGGRSLVEQIKNVAALKQQ